MMQCGWPGTVVMVVVVMLTGLAAAQPAEQVPPRDLADPPWQDKAHGISVRPPIGTRLVEQTADDYLLRIIDEAGKFQITVALKKSAADLTLEQVLRSAREQIKTFQPASDVVGSEVKKIGQLEGAIIYFRVPQPVGDDLLIGQAIGRIDAQRFVLMELRCVITAGPQYIPTFEAVTQSLSIANRGELAAQRRAALERGQAWRHSLSIEKLHKSLIPEQFFRLVENGRDIGYLRVTQAQNANGVALHPRPGVEVEVRSRIVAQGVTIDSRAAMYLADDDAAEVWTITTTYRQRDARGQEQLRTFTETGARTGETMEIAINGPEGLKKPKYKRPVVGYLSKVEAETIGQLLPRDRAGDYGFYWFDSRSGKMTFRSEQVTPTLSGFTLTSRPTPNAAALRATYDAQGRLLRKQLGPNRELVAATRQMILRQWKGL
jgi:hypothetical protein